MPWFMGHQKEPSYKGPVKEIKEYHPLIVSEPELQDTSYYFCTYSIDKKLLSVYISDVDGTLNMKYYWSNHLDSIINYGEYNSIEYYIYDTNNRLEKIVINHLDHRFYDTVIVVYNTAGYPVSTINKKYSEANKPWFEWYNNGKIKGVGSKHWQNWYEYDNKGRLTKSLWNTNNIVTYTYNDYDDIVVEEHIYNKKFLFEEKTSKKYIYSYKYDEYDNWIEKYKDGKLIAIRKITYY